MNFFPLEVSDYQRLKGFFENQEYRLSNYSLFSLIVWSSPRLKTYYATENDTLIIGCKSTTNPENNHLILPISGTRRISLEYLSTLAKSLEFACYSFVPGDFLLKYDREEIESYFEVSEQREFDDYIYLTENLMNLKGNKYTRQRNLLHQFHKKYVDTGKVETEMINRENAPECLNFLYDWCELRRCNDDENEGLACERTATINALNSIDNLEAKGLLIRINGRVSAFGIGSRLTDDMSVLNFEKAYPDIKGLYQFLDNECAKKLFSSVKYINKESDMNLPNLAQSKKSYNPIMILQAYRLAVP